MASQTQPARPRKPQPAALTAYLTLYNLASAAAWGYILYRAWHHMLRDGGYQSLGALAAGNKAARDGWDARARRGFSEFGDSVKWVQTAAVLEAVHSGLRLVRSPFGTTVAQIASRLALVWGVCELFPRVPCSPFYISMVTAWSCAEIIRYIHYAIGLVGIKSKALEWLRYTAFYILYPVGAGSEAVLIYLSAPYAKEQYGPLAALGVYALVSLWPPSLFFLMTYMHSQRRKHLGGGARKPSRIASSSTAVAPGPAATSTPITAVASATSAPAAASPATMTAAARAPKAVTAQIEASNVLPSTKDDTPARSTRSRARKSVAPQLG
ncbi:hypothetical protein JCM10213_000585 [Rhodosporidiobolus nylandii]